MPKRRRAARRGWGSGSIYETKGRPGHYTLRWKGEYLGTWSSPDGRSDPAGANLELARRIAERGGAPRTDADPTLAEYAERVLAGVGANGSARRSPTEYQYRLRLREVVDRWGGDVRLREVTRERVEALLRALEAEGRGWSVRLQILKTLSMIFERAEQDGIVASNPVRKIPRPKQMRRRTGTTYAEAAPRLLAAARKRDVVKPDRLPLHAAIAVALATGQRLGSVFGLDWHDWNRGRGTLRFERQAVRDPLPEGGTVLRLREQKTDRAGHDHPLPLTRYAAEALRIEWEKQARPNAGPIFPGQQPGEPRDPKSAAGAIRAEVLTAAGFESLTFHDLRRLVRSHLASTGLSDVIVNAFVGHAPPRGIEAVYTEVGPDALRRCADALELSDENPGNVVTFAPRQELQT